MLISRPSLTGPSPTTDTSIRSRPGWAGAPTSVSAMPGRANSTAGSLSARQTAASSNTRLGPRNATTSRPSSHTRSADQCGPSTTWTGSCCLIRMTRPAGRASPPMSHTSRPKASTRSAGSTVSSPAATTSSATTRTSWPTSCWSPCWSSACSRAWVIGTYGPHATCWRPGSTALASATTLARARACSSALPSTAGTSCRGMQHSPKWSTPPAALHMHSHGNINPILDQVVGAGIDMLNPLDPTDGMDLADIRQRHPKLTLVGGGIDKFMYDRSLDEIEARLRRSVELYGRRGRFVLMDPSGIVENTDIARYQAIRRISRRERGQPRRRAPVPRPRNRPPGPRSAGGARWPGGIPVTAHTPPAPASQVPGPPWMRDSRSPARVGVPSPGPTSRCLTLRTPCPMIYCRTINRRFRRGDRRAGP